MPSRSAVAVLQLDLPLFQTVEDTRLDAAVRLLDKAKTLVEEVREDVPPEPPAQLCVIHQHPLLPLSTIPVYEPPAERTMVVRRGRKCANGERRGARILRRMTTYYPPELFEEMQAFAFAEDMGLSELVQAAVREYLERR